MENNLVFSSIRIGARNEHFYRKYAAKANIGSNI